MLDAYTFEAAKIYYGLTQSDIRIFAYEYAKANELSVQDHGQPINALVLTD